MYSIEFAQNQYLYNNLRSQLRAIEGQIYDCQYCINLNKSGYKHLVGQPIAAIFSKRAYRKWMRGYARDNLRYRKKLIELRKQEIATEIAISHIPIY